MPVIGRLDGQVEEVLINPVGQRGRAAREPQDRAPDASAADEGGGARGERTDEAAPPARDEAATPPAGAEAAAPPLREAEPARRPDALPVWLL